MVEPPPGSVPVTFNSSFEVTDTTLTQAEYILSDKLTGVETVAVARDGRLGIVDKFGRVRGAWTVDTFTRHQSLLVVQHSSWSCTTHLQQEVLCRVERHWPAAAGVASQCVLPAVLQQQ